MPLIGLHTGATRALDLGLLESMMSLMEKLQGLQYIGLWRPKASSWDDHFTIQTVRVIDVNPELFQQLGIFKQSIGHDVEHLADGPRRALAQLVRAISLGILWCYTSVLNKTVRCAGMFIISLHRALMQAVLESAHLSRSIRFANADFFVPNRRVESIGFR